MNGAEKLLGKGRYALLSRRVIRSRSRVQGAFVSDKEVADVVELFKRTQTTAQSQRGCRSADRSNGNTALVMQRRYNGGENERDMYFADAGKFIIDKDKASIGMLQRVFKIGFNRAARIMDQLC